MKRKFNRQEVFDTVLDHLRKQGKRSMTPGGCAYRGENGTMCAVGCLIPDELYNPALEGKNINCQEVKDTLKQVYTHVDLRRERPDYGLLKEMQMAHDMDLSDSNTNPMERWEESMRRIADELKLNYRAPEGAPSHGA